jgi:peroxiredoxin
MKKLLPFILFITGSLRISAQAPHASGSYDHISGLYDTLRSAVEPPVPDAALQQECRDYVQYVHPDGGSTPVLSAQMKSFILIHPDYHLSLLLFKQLVETGEITKPQRRFEEFSGTLQRSALGQATQEAIHRDEQQVSAGKMAPDFTARTPDGKELRLSSLRGKYVLLDFWASWCGPCRLENPNLVENYNRFKNKNFMIVSFSLDGNAKAWQEAIEADHLDWYHVSDLKDWHSDIVKAYMVPHVPQNFLLDPEGKIIAVELRGDALGQELEKIFK